MKVSVSLPSEDVEFLDAYAIAAGLESRSAAVHKAVRLLRVAELGADYGDAWDEWDRDAENQAWEAATPDGIADR